MTSRYVEPVDVLRRGHVPAHFLWCHRLYVVRAVLDHWLDRGPWLSPSLSADRPEDSEEREVWRVEASAGRCGPPGIYDLCAGASTREWALVRTLSRT